MTHTGFSQLRNGGKRVQSTLGRWKSSVLEPLNPALPNRVGLGWFRRRSSWALDPKLCPCDLHFVEYLDERHLTNKTIFHFGTGGHHYVGVECHARGTNEVLGVTAAAREHQAYVKLVLADAALAKSYKVLFADIYTLTETTLPDFDVVSLFHLCEFTPSSQPEDAGAVIHDDESLLGLFVSKLKPGGKILFYEGSFGWRRAQAIVSDFVDRGLLRPVESFKTLLVYEAGA